MKAVAAHAAGRAFHRDRAGKAQGGVLADAIAHIARHAAHCAQGPGQQNRALAPRDHARQHMAQRPERRPDIDPERGFEGFVGVVAGQGVHSFSGGIEEQSVDWPMMGSGSVQRGDQALLVADIAGYGEGRRADRRRSLTEHSGPPRDQRDLAARSGDLLRRCPANAG